MTSSTPIIISEKIIAAKKGISAIFLFLSISSAILLFSAILASEFCIDSKTPEINISEADRQRLEIKEKIKKGEITLDELPLPIVEEDETEKNEAHGKKNRGKKK